MNNSAHDNKAQAPIGINPHKPAHYYRTEIPNIVFELDISDSCLRLYSIIKKIAGDDGISWCSQNTLAAKARCSDRTVRDNLKKLTQPHPELNGKALIEVTKRINADGSYETSLITIVDIWADNGKYFQGGCGNNFPRGTEKFAYKEEPPLIEEEEDKSSLEKKVKQAIPNMTAEEFEYAWDKHSSKKSSQNQNSVAYLKAVIRDYRKKSPKQKETASSQPARPDMPKEIELEGDKMIRLAKQKQEAIQYFNDEIEGMEEIEDSDIEILEVGNVTLKYKWYMPDLNHKANLCIRWDSDNALKELQELKEIILSSYQQNMHVGEEYER